MNTGILFSNIAFLALFIIVSGHPGGKALHSHVNNKTRVLIKLEKNIQTMEALLSKQEGRLSAWFDQLKTKTRKIRKMAAKVESRRPEVKGNCSIPVAPPNGHILGLEYDTRGAPIIPISGVVYYVCNDGFHLTGPRSKKCLSNGTWTRGKVTCTDVTAKIIACSKLNCRHDGSCVESSNSRYRCACVDGFYGKRCQKMNLHVVKPRCVGVLGESCSCPIGYRIGQERRLCFDVNECSRWNDEVNDIEIVTIPDDIGSMAKRNADFRPCRYRCVNTPGSYKCLCPTGFAEDTRGECFDVNECDTGNHSCTGRALCINTVGGYRCAEVTCPHHYYASSPATCRRRKCKFSDRNCSSRVAAYTYKFIELPPDTSYPSEVFYVTANSSATSNHFTVLPGEQSGHFQSRVLNSHTAALVIARPLDDPQVSVDFQLKQATGRRSKRRVVKYVYRLVLFAAARHL